MRTHGVTGRPSVHSPSLGEPCCAEFFAVRPKSASPVVAYPRAVRWAQVHSAVALRCCRGRPHQSPSSPEHPSCGPLRLPPRPRFFLSRTAAPLHLPSLSLPFSPAPSSPPLQAGMTPLYAAARNGSASVVDLLLATTGVNLLAVTKVRDTGGPVNTAERLHDSWKASKGAECASLLGSVNLPGALSAPNVVHLLSCRSLPFLRRTVAPRSTSLRHAGTTMQFAASWLRACLSTQLKR